MASRFVAGVDWAGGQWLAVTFRGGSYEDCIVETEFTHLCEECREVDLMIVDLPIGLPEDDETLASRFCIVSDGPLWG
jgi:predicted RNase H-like nuclease